MTRPPRPRAHGRWPQHPGPILGWLIGETRQLPAGGASLRELGRRPVGAGLPLRTSFDRRPSDPQLCAAGFGWQRAWRRCAGPRRSTPP